MDYLFKGIKEFQEIDFIEQKKLFSDLSRNQSPHTLFIGCSDSRLVPNLITKTLPGELFVIRNIANIVPIYRDSNEYLSTTSAIEYSIKILNVKNIVICGHSNCGGCNALYWDDASLKKIPHTKKWLELAYPVIEKVKKEIDISLEPEKREWITEQLNIIEQMNHLLSYPFILEKYNNNELKIFGWYYIIETGEIFDYDKKTMKFIKITH